MGKAVLGKCPRCGSFVLVDKSAGVTLAVDLLPVDASGFGFAVAGGIGLWWAQNEPGQPARVLGHRSAAENPSWGQNGAQTGTQRLHQEHACGALHRDMIIVDVAAPKGSAPATPGAAEAGNHHRAAPVAGAPAPVSLSPVISATPRPSEPRGRCGVCRKPIHPGVEWWGFTHGAEFIYGEHVDCE